MTLFQKIRLIWQGWSNYVLDRISDIRYRNYFHARYEICRECPRNVHGICSLCGCVVRMKTMSEDSECPDGKWKTIPETIADQKRRS